MFFAKNNIEENIFHSQVAKDEEKWYICTKISHTNFRATVTCLNNN